MSSSNSHKQKPTQKQAKRPQIGLLGENLVAAWLQSNGWEIIARRWRCRWGEIDIIAGEIADRPSPEPSYQRIAFVEVKTRNHRSWDAGGLLSINAQKQAKLLQTAEIFLSDRPDLSDRPCQFDIALVRVRYQRRSPTNPETSSSNSSNSSPLITLGQPISMKDATGEYELTLHNYIAGAFEADT